MKKYMAPIVVTAIVSIIVLLMSMFVVDQTEMALVQRFGQVHRVIDKPGLYFKMPFADVVWPIDRREIIWNSDNMEVQVSDKKQYVVDMVTIVRVVDPLRFRESVGANLSLARKNIEARLDAALRQTYGKRTFDAALSKDRVVMMLEIRDQVRDAAKNLGIEIVDVRIRRTDLMKEVLDSTYQRMRSERLAEAQDLRSRGEAMRQEIQAQADRKRIERTSEANRQASIIRGAGDAEKNRVFAEVANKDPDFFTFYISMQAYLAGLKGNNSSFVISPDSSFFRYFSENPGGLGMGKVPAPTAPVAGQ